MKTSKNLLILLALLLGLALSAPVMAEDGGVGQQDDDSIDCEAVVNGQGGEPGDDTTTTEPATDTPVQEGI